MSTRSRAIAALASAALLLSLFPPHSALARSSGPPAERTGAPGEQTCLNGCHTGTPLNGGGGALDLIGAPASYAPGADYSFWVELAEIGMSRWGFQLTSLDDAHASAGSLQPGNPDSTQVVNGGGKEYLEHNSTGTWQGIADGPVTWLVDWTAPAAGAGEVTFWFAGNAANNNGSRTGDHIYAASFTSAEAGAAPVLDLTLSNIPLSVPAGGSLDLSATLTNTTAVVQTFNSAALDATGPVPPTTLPLYAGPPVPVAPSSPLSAPVSVPVPGFAPAGSYLVDISISSDGQVIDTESFNVAVTD